LEELKVDPERCLFVAGSAYGLIGTAKVGLPAYWHDRIGMKAPEGVPAPLVHEPSLKPLWRVTSAHDLLDLGRLLSDCVRHLGYATPSS
jgi:hypothetical protein